MCEICLYTWASSSISPVAWVSELRASPFIATPSKSLTGSSLNAPATWPRNCNTERKQKKRCNSIKKLKSEEFFNPCASVKMGIHTIFKKVNFVFASIKFQKITVQFCYFRLYIGIETVSCRPLQRIARMDVDWNFKFNAVHSAITKKIVMSVAWGNLLSISSSYP